LLSIKCFVIKIVNKWMQVYAISVCITHLLLIKIKNLCFKCSNKLSLLRKLWLYERQTRDKKIRPAGTGFRYWLTKTSSPKRLDLKRFDRKDLMNKKIWWKKIWCKKNLIVWDRMRSYEIVWDLMIFDNKKIEQNRFNQKQTWAKKNC
jgi:hypothetical protein